MRACGPPPFRARHGALARDDPVRVPIVVARPPRLRDRRPARLACDRHAQQPDVATGETSSNGRQDRQARLDRRYGELRSAVDGWKCRWHFSIPLGLAALLPVSPPRVSRGAAVPALANARAGGSLRVIRVRSRCCEVRPCLASAPRRSRAAAPMKREWRFARASAAVGARSRSPRRQQPDFGDDRSRRFPHDTPSHGRAMPRPWARGTRVRSTTMQPPTSLADTGGSPQALTAILRRCADAASDDYLDVDDGQPAIAVSRAGRARIFGYGKLDTAPATSAASSAKLGPNENLRLLAIRALGRIRDPKRSEIASLWAHEPAFDAWLADLLDRLTAAGE